MAAIYGTCDQIFELIAHFDHDKGSSASGDRILVRTTNATSARTMQVHQLRRIKRLKTI